MIWYHWYKGKLFNDQNFLFTLNYGFFLLNIKLFSENNNSKAHFSNLTSPFKLN
jgi:hypothetical protein